MTGQPEISVIVPVCNVQDHVGGCIASLRAQTWTDFEAVVVDDGSTDDSPGRMAAAIGGDARFVMLRQENRGLPAARNAGLERVRGRFVAFLDGDDRYAPGFLQVMRAALVQSGADWAACAVRMTYPDGRSEVHSAIHGMALTAGLPATRLCPMDDWRQVIRHFPSAWNKLYRRDLIAGLRFDEGTWFEDHAFFARVAARSGALLHVARPLCIHTRGRPGQITGTDCERVFEQIGVLETLAGLIGGAGKRGGRAAFSRLACRLLFERACAIRDPGRRARLAAAGARFLKRHGLEWSDAWDTDVSPAWAAEMAGRCPLSVILYWRGGRARLDRTVQALAGQADVGFETRIVVAVPWLRAAAQERAEAAGLARTRTLVARGWGGPAAARARGLAQAAGDFALILEAGDAPERGAFLHWLGVMYREAADLGISAVLHGEDGAYDSGFGRGAPGIAERPRETAWRLAPDEVRRLTAPDRAAIWRVAFLRRTGLGGSGGPPTVQAAARASAATVWMPHPWLRLSGPPVAAAAPGRMHRVRAAARRRLGGLLRRFRRLASAAQATG